MTPSRILDRAMAPVSTSKYRPREHRDTDRGRLSAEKARASGESALTCALAHIDAAFGAAERINRKKMRIEAALARGPRNPDIRCFYSNVTELLRRRCVRTLDEALTILGAEKARTATIESYLGVPRLIIRRETLNEAILALRFLRRKRMNAYAPLLIAMMSEGPPRRPVINLVAAE